MTHFNKFYQKIATNRLSHWLNSLPAQLDHWQKNELHGEYKHWQKTLAALPKAQPSNVNLSHGVTVGSKADFNEGQHKRLDTIFTACI